MSAGCVHQKASVALASGFLLGSFAFGPGWEYAIGALVGIILTPDLDVDNGYIGNTIIRNRLGRPVEKGWDMLWYFYRKSLKHGSELSHFPVISTMFRLIYLFLFLLVLPLGVVELVVPGAADVGHILSASFWKILEHWQVIIGLIGSDIIHWGLDVMTTEHKSASNHNKKPCRPLRLPTFSRARTRSART